MAFNRYPRSKYATIEINHADFRVTGNEITNMPLGSVFTEAAPCENGMWLSGNRAAGALAASTLVAEPYGIVYTGEVGYLPTDQAAKNFCAVAGDYPRVGMLSKGDVITTNAFGYDTTEFATAAAVDTALAALKTTPLYVVALSGQNVPKLTATKGTTNTWGYVVKACTLPNGEKGIQYQIANA